MTTIKFNTGRLYTKNGQPITATLDESTRAVYFIDHSRLIAGWFILSEGQGLTPATVMAVYDASQYEMGHWALGIPDAAAMAMMAANRAA